PCPRAQVDNPLACFRVAGERDELAALVLDFDLPGFEAGFALDADVGRESNAPRTDLRRHRIDKLLEQLVPRAFRDVDSQVQWSAVEQRRPLVRGDQRRQLRGDPSRYEACLR